MEMRFVSRRGLACYGVRSQQSMRVPGKRSRSIMDLERFLGGNPLGIVIRLVLISIVVGIAMSALG